MNRIASSLLVLALSATTLTSVAKAETVKESQATPFQVTSLAYQGRLTDNGIPGYGSLAAGVRSGAIAAEDVIAAAIEAGRVDETALDDRGFVTAVDQQLQILVDNN